MLLEKISNARGVSGNEKGVRQVLREAVAEYCDDIKVDALGNLICYKKARTATTDKPLRLMVSAHMDEVGLIVTGFNGDGTLRFGCVGGIDGRVLVARTVLIGDTEVPGVIGCSPIHLVPAEARTKAVDADKLVIDIGATDEASARKLVSLGDYACFAVTYEPLLDGQLRAVKGKAFDDRAGCTVLVELLKEDLPVDLYACFTSQEEVGLRGARVAAYAVDPDAAIALEGTICDDLPKEQDKTPVTEVGKGPAITFMDRSFIADQRLVKLLTSTAKAEGIPCQFKRAAAGGTDAGAIHLAREGVPSVTVAVPCRYIHAPASVLSLNDLENTVQLLAAAIKRMNGGLA